MAAPKPKLTLSKLNKSDLVTGRYVLIVETPESRRAVSLNNSVFTIGRHPSNNLVLNEPLASRHHATVAWMKYTEGDNIDYAYWIIDGKGKRKRSRNGIYINGAKKTLHRLNSGDIILIGNDIKISYNFITNSTDSSQFFNYCNVDKVEYKPKNPKHKFKKDTVIEGNAEEQTVINNFKPNGN